MKGKRLRATAQRAKSPVGVHRAKKAVLFSALVALLVVVVIAAYAAFFQNTSGKTSATSNTGLVQFVRKAQDLDALLRMSPEQLEGVDIAEMNLLCATGLPGSEGLGVSKARDRLNDWAECVRYWTEQSMWDFRENPDKFENSEAKFRVLLLISVVQKDFGVHYTDRGERECDFSNSKNAFLHGMIDDTNGGTCASMPVAYVAVGRRLGYPMKLVLAKTHVFARWEDPKSGEKFNIEGTNPRFNDHPDSYYRNWPAPISDAELKLGWYLKPLTAAEELAVFLQNRACCLMTNKRYAEAREVYTHSYRLAPQNPLGRLQIASAAAEGRPVPIRSDRVSPLDESLDWYQPPRRYPDPMAEAERLDAFNRENARRIRSLQPPHPHVPGGVQPYLPPQPGMPRAPNPYGPHNPHGPQAPRQPGRP